MKAYAEIVVAPAADTPGSAILLHFDSKRYILGHVAEGTQRALSERLRIGKLGEIFISGRTEWANTGGLVGLILTLGDQMKNKPQVKGAAPAGVVVHGGRNLLLSVATTRSYVLRSAMRLRVDESLEANGRPDFRDENVTIKYLHIRSQPASPVSPARRKRNYGETAYGDASLERLKNTVENMFWREQRSVDIDDDDPLSYEKEVHADKKSRTSEDEGLDEQESSVQIPLPDTHLPSSRPSRVSVSYIVTLHDQRGKFLVKVANELGVPSGPAFRQLTNGETFTTKSGRVVRPEEVMEPTRLGPAFAVCDIPDASYIEDLSARKEWEAPNAQGQLACFFWILGPGVVEDQRLQGLMARFPKAQHILSSSDVCPNHIKFKGAAKFNERLHKLDPSMFPHLLRAPISINVTSPIENSVIAQQGMIYDLEPVRKLNTEGVDELFDAAAAVDSLGPSFPEAVGKVHASLTSDPCPVEAFPGSEVEVCTLGTGSALPSRYRNVSATMLTIPSLGTILLDSGEGTMGQLRRVLDPDTAANRLRNLRVLYISHLHADHHLGSISVLKAQHQLVPSSQRTFIVAPRRFLNFLTEYSSVEDFGIERLAFVPSEEIRGGDRPSPRNLEALKRELGISSWVTAFADHCQSSFTTAITFNSGFKVAYSGDTRPTTTFTEIGRNATLLVHEATFDDELIEEAIAKKHSTIAEAVGAGRQMDAKAIVLTHFSQRYPKKPNMDVDAQNVLYAFDCMKFTVGEVGRFSRLANGIAEVYRDVTEEDT